MNNRLDEIRAREQAATPGEWESDRCGCYVWQKENIKNGFIIAEMRGLGYLTALLSLSDDEAFTIQTANAEFIAHSRSDIPYLLSEVERLKAELERVTKERDAAINDVKSLGQYDCKCCFYDNKKVCKANLPPNEQDKSELPICIGWQYRGLEDTTNER